MMKKRILITGANGNLGGSLTKELVKNTDYDIIAVSNSNDKVTAMLEREEIEDRNRVLCFDQERFFSSDWKDMNVLAAVHMAFSRANRSSKDIANSLDYSKDVFRRLSEMSVPRVIYMSSQSVYGTTSEWRREDTVPSPETLYSMAKYAGEKLLESEFRGILGTCYTSLRLDYVIQSQRLVNTLCKNAKTSRSINLKGGKQTFSYIDKGDVAKAIRALLAMKEDWKPVYNVGPDKMRYSLTEIADVVVAISEKHGIHGVKVDLEESNMEHWSGMDSSLFMKDTGWGPSMDIYQMVEKVFMTV